MTSCEVSEPKKYRAQLQGSETSLDRRYVLAPSTAAGEELAAELPN
jgi:hypothetical protein